MSSYQIVRLAVTVETFLRFKVPITKYLLCTFLKINIIVISLKYYEKNISFLKQTKNCCLDYKEENFPQSLYWLLISLSY